jgi:hypothetical protein
LPFGTVELRFERREFGFELVAFFVRVVQHRLVPLVRNRAGCRGNCGRRI